MSDKVATCQGYHGPTEHCKPLPHTGFDLGLLVFFAVVVLLIGALLRWRFR